MMNICPSCLQDNGPSDRFCIACGTSLSPQTPLPSPASGLQLPVGTLLKQGNYKLEKAIGQGGFGITYKATYCPNAAIVAIKELWPEGGYRQGKSVLWPTSISPADRREEINKFKQEAAYLQRCQSPHVVKVYECFEENSTVYIAMEFIQGRPLSEFIEPQNRLDEHQVIPYLIQVAQGLSIVHQNQLLHRDIKPENIMIGPGDRAVLIDFGTAREFIAGKTGTMTRMLSAGYAPVEQYSLHAKRLAASDIYSLCASLYELLTGQLPSDAIERFNILQQGQPDPLIPPRKLNPNISPHIERVILRGMSFPITERIQTAEDFIDALNGKLVSPRHQKAKDFLKQGNLTDAVRTYETCLQQEPDNGEAAVELALVLVYLDGDRAEAAAQKAMQLQPGDGRSYGVCGLLSCRRLQWSNAVQQLQQGLSLTPNEAWMHANLAWALGKQGNWKSADASIQEALRLDPDSIFGLGVQAWVAFHRRQWKFVVTAASQAIFKSQQEPPQKAIALQSWVYPFAIAALDKVTTKKASDVARRVRSFVAQVPHSPVALGLQGWYEYRNGNLVASGQSFDLASQCDNLPDWVARDRGLICEHLDDFATAAKWYEERYQQTPANPWICYRLGTVLGKLGQWHQGKTYLEQAVKLDPQFAPAYRNLGWVLLNLQTADGKVNLIRQLLAAYRQALHLYKAQNPEEAQHIQALFQAIDMSL